MAGTKINGIWRTMIQRCSNKNAFNYKHYGGRGIIVCREWMIFENFYRDMGDIPEKMTIDRIDNNGNYTPENCRWATRKKQANNTRRNYFITYNNKTQTVAEWARELDINYSTLHKRIRRGWNLERALSEKVC